MGERLLCKQEVDGSIPFTSTNFPGAAQRRLLEWIGRSKLFVGQQRPAFAIFDMVKSGVTGEASADACCLTCRQSSFFGNAEKRLLMGHAIGGSFFGKSVFM